ncbi:unnamed protein product [Brachionus calyciflorus]|uniref:Uncharacterized protein n=1 Tax=Brachionus calyciflorus TaxID=104777 RepID=A0A813M8R6_9BILA|nr:unnamed protein product [Brachionus calyciflorus]
MTNIVKVFHDIPRVKSLYDSLEIKLKRHENNYFVGKSLDSIDQSLCVLVRPIAEVTSSNLSATVSVDIQSKIRKIHWVLNCKENFAENVKRKYSEKQYTSFFDIYNDCKIIYQEHCPNYCEAKATVSSENGRRVHKKKTKENEVGENQIGDANFYMLYMLVIV